MAFEDEELLPWDEGYVESVHECEIDGEWVGYDYCSESRDSYADLPVTYLGTASKYTVDGVLNHYDKDHHFWEKAR